MKYGFPVKFFKHFPLLLFGFSLVAQVQQEVNPPANIKSIVFVGETEEPFPIIKLGETIYLEFDDILANEQDYYYKLVHCDYDWTPSDLLKSQYLSGLDNQRIIDYGNSLTTLQPYSNYRLSIPNFNTRLRVSGNWVLEIYNNYNELQFSRRFVVYTDQVVVGVVPKRSRDFDFLDQKQAIQITINGGGFQLLNPKREVKIAVLQNYYWPSAITDVPPQFVLGNLLEYKYDKEISFFGGNEYLNFDTSNLRAPSSRISYIEFLDIYHHYLFPDKYRYDEGYVYNPDINGDFELRTREGVDVSREAEYTMVHFSLPYSEYIGLDDVYVYGKFNNFALEDLNRMNLNEETGNYEASILMKQGFYNYKYVVKKLDGEVEYNLVGGNYHFAENEYLVLVYYRNFGDLYDSIIGVGSANSENITN